MGKNENYGELICKGDGFRRAGKSFSLTLGSLIRKYSFLEGIPLEDIKKIDADITFYVGKDKRIVIVIKSKVAPQ